MIMIVVGVNSTLFLIIMQKNVEILKTKIFINDLFTAQFYICVI